MKKITLLLLFIGAVCQAQTRVYTLKVDKWAKVTDSVQSKLYRQGGDTLATKAYVRERSFDTTTIYQNLSLRLKNIDTTTRTKVLTRKATDSLINYALTGTVDTKGNWDASGNTLPSISVKTGDKWTISVKGFVSPDSFYVGDVIIAKIDDPGQTITNWNHIYASQPKSVNLVLAGSSQVGALKYTGTTKTDGCMFGGASVTPNNGIYTAGFAGNWNVYHLNASGNIYVSSGNGIYYNSNNYINLASNNIRLVSNSIQAQLVGGNWGVNVTNNAPAAKFHGHTTGTGETAMLLTNTTTGLGISDGVSLNLVNGKDAALRLGEYNSSFNVEYRSVKKLSIDSVGYLYNLRPTFSSVFFDSTRVIELDVNTPKLISNTWGNLWPNSVMVGFTENKDTAIVGYTGNYNMTFDFNCNVSVTASFRYHVKKKAANSTTVTTIYRKEVSNAGTTVNRAMSLNSNFSAGDRVWLELENITNGTDVTVYGGSFAITANYLNP